MPRIPKVLHYFWGMDTTDKPWSLVHYVCVRSAVERIKPDRTFIHYEYRPVGRWWKETCKIATPVRIRAPRYVFGNPVTHPAHRSDVARLRTLIARGGIYLDADVLVHESFDHLLDHSMVLGEEGIDAQYGLCNGVILAEPGAPFLRRWYDEYHWFRSSGVDEYWNEHSVGVPSTLAKAHPAEITVLPHTAFHWPLWTHDHLPRIFEPGGAPDDRGTLANHLWESVTWGGYLEDLTPEIVRTRDSNFHRWARPYLAHLPDAYGAPTLGDRISLRVRRRLRHPDGPLWYAALLAGHRRLGSPLRGWRAKLSVARELGVRGSLARLGARLLPYVSPKRHRQRVFRQVYQQYHWGFETPGGFYSGEGSRGAPVDAYVTFMARILGEHIARKGAPLTVVDLGCGDFEVGRRLVDKVPGITYIGCDIVPELCTHLSGLHAGERVAFRCVDIVSEPVPKGDVYLVRQVLQHLSNDDIQLVLQKLLTFEHVYITESYPVDEVGPVNPDKPTNFDVRFDWRIGRGRGVELDKAPFFLPTRELLRVPRGSVEMLVTFAVDRAPGARSVSGPLQG